MGKKLKKRDIEIINALRNNCRIKLKEISLRHEMPISTLFDRKKNLLKYFNKYTSLLNFKKLGYSFYGLFILYFNKENEIALLDKYNINNLQKCESNIFLASIYFESCIEITNLEEKLKNKNIKYSSFLLEPVMEESFFLIN